MTLEPFDDIGSPIWKTKKKFLFEGVNLIDILPKLFGDIGRSEIVKRWKSGALKIKNEKIDFDLNRDFTPFDASISSGLWMIRVTLGKMVAVIVLE